MSSDVIIVSKDIARRAESLINSGNVIKGVEMLLVENVFHSETCTKPSGIQSDSTNLYKKGINHLQNTPFDLLGVDVGCKTVDVRKAYKKLALKYHPDKNPKTTPLFQVIQAASSKLSDATERSKEEVQAKKKPSMSSFPSAAPPRPSNANPTANPTANPNYPSASAYANSNAAGQGSGFASAYPSYGQGSNSNKSNPSAAPAGAGGGAYYHNNFYNQNNNYYQNYYNNPNPNSNNNNNNNAAGGAAGTGASNPYAKYAYGNNSKASNNNPSSNNNNSNYPQTGGAYSNAKADNANNANNPYAQANASRKAANPADPSNNFRNDEAKRKNYYEDLLKEQYRKAAESDQRAREYAAKRAAEQRNEYDQFFKKQSANSNASKATEPPLSSFRPAPPTNNANNASKPTVPSAFDYNYYANINKEPSNPPTRTNSSHSMNSNPPNPNAGPQGAAYPTAAAAAAAAASVGGNAYAAGGAGVGRTYRATSDGKVYQQQPQAAPVPQPKVSPRPEPVPAAAPSASAANNTKQPTASSSSSKTETSSNSNKVPSFSKKTVVPKPFGFRVNSIASTMVELEWSTSQMHHVSLGVELSWKEKSSTVWEMSEKLIRSGCCRKKNLAPGKIYEFRVRSVEELSNGAIGGKSDWSDVITASLSPAHTTSTSSLNPNPKTDNSAGSNKTAAPSKASNATPVSNPTTTSSSASNANANPKTSSSNSTNTKASNDPFQPHTPSKLDAIPQKFRRFNSKIKINTHQMHVEEEPKSTKPTKKEEKATQPSIQKQLSSSREAWGHDTLPKSANANEGLNSLDIDEEVDDEDDVLLQSKSSHDEEVADEEDEIAMSSEQVHTARPGIGKPPQTQTDTPPAPNSNSSANSKAPTAASSASPAAAGLSYDSDSSVGSDRSNQQRKSSQQGKKKKDPLLSPVKDRENEDDDEDEATKSSKNQKAKAEKVEDDDENYSDDDFDVEEETHYQLIPPAPQQGSGGKKIKNRGSKTNLMEVLGSNGEEQYCHPVHQEPYPRSEVKGYVIGDRTIVACATVGDWVRVKIHIMKDTENHMKKMKSYRKLDEDALNAKQKQDLWGWCLKKDKHHEYLNAMQFKRPLPTTSSASKRPDPTTADFKTPPNNRKSLGTTRNSFNNTSLFDLHIPVPTTANKESGRNKKEKAPTASASTSSSTTTASNAGAKKTSSSASSSKNKQGSKITEWMECMDDMGNLYYYNEKTNESSWDPPDWIEEEDATTGAKYYCHFVHLDNGEVSMNSTWTQPKEFAKVIRSSAM